MNTLRYSINSGLLILFAVLFSLVPLSITSAQVPFGGFVTTINPICQFPPGMLVYQTPAAGPPVLFYTYGTPFAVPTPPLPMLGMALATPMPCLFYCGISICTAGAGNLISFVQIGV
ncbi:MAG: hypothetical protein WDZ88_01965 [Candidatus Paceibacterota bacterium]